MLKGDQPIRLEAGGLFLKIQYRHTRDDEGITIDVIAAGAGENTRLLRFDCFEKAPHAHFGPSGRDKVLDMKEKEISDPLRWTLGQLKTQLPSMVREAGYGEIAGKIDQKAVAEAISQLEKDL